MNIFEAALTAVVAAAVVPYKVVVKQISEEENAPKKVSIESLTYRVDVTPVEKDGVVSRNVSFTVPGEGVRNVVGFFKRQCTNVCTTAGNVKDKVASTVSEKVSSIREKRAAKKAANEMASSESVIEIPVEEVVEA